MTTRIPQSVSTLTTAASAMHSEEVSRTRVFVQIGWLVTVCVVLATLVLPGNTQIRNALLATLGVGVLGSITAYRSLDDRYEPRMMAVLAVVAVIAGQLGILYVGVTSAAALIVALGVYFFCRTESFAIALGVYLLVAGAHAAEATLVITGVIDDPGFAPVDPSLSWIAHAAGQLLLQQMYGMCFFLARMTRRSTLKAIEQLQGATRLAAQRDVQLAELRQDLDRALKIGGPGRFSGHVVGSWTLGNVLGRGAMGEVYEAAHTKTGSEAAVKLLRREMLSDPHHVERFFREVRIASSLDSPHVVKVLEASTAEDPIPFLAMERLRGRTLGDLVREGPVIGAPLRALVSQLGQVLELARRAGIVHRDLKPHNIFVTDAGIWKVLDFGVAVLADSSGTLTHGQVIGTPTYMAPEQARGEQVDHRADLYAMGAVLYRCLTGRAPYSAKDTPTLLYAVVHTMPLRPTEVGPHLEAFLAIAMAKTKIERFDSAAELASSFLAALDNRLDDAMLKRARTLLRNKPWSEPSAGDKLLAEGLKPVKRG